MPRKVAACAAALLGLLQSATALASSPSAHGTDEPSLDAPTVRLGTNASRHLFGVEVSPMSPFLMIWAVQGTYSFWRYGDFVTGYVHRRERISHVGRAYGHTLVFGYRQYIWHGLNLDFETWTAYDEITSYVDGESYRGFDGWAAVSPGYRLDTIGDRTARLYLLAQVTIASPVFRTNPPPRFSPGPLVIPVVWVGARAF